jgi:rubrerythrin
MTPVNPDILAALTSGIQSEVAAYVFYIEAAKRIDDADINATLHQLAGEEKGHFHILEREYDSLVRSEKWISTADVLKQKGLPEINEEMTAVHKELIGQVRTMKGRPEILKMALRLETEARDLFRGASQKSTSKEAKDIFDQLTRFEEGHMIIIRRLMDQAGG